MSQYFKRDIKNLLIVHSCFLEALVRDLNINGYFHN